MGRSFWRSRTRARLSARAALLAAALAAAGAALTLWLRGAPPLDAPAAAVPVGAAAAAQPAGPALAAADASLPGSASRVSALAAEPAAAPPPPGVGAAEWAALEQELAGRPAELARLRAHFEFAEAVRALRDGVPGSAERRAAAQAVDAGLHARFAARELSAGEARLLKIAALAELEPDPAARDAALARWQQDLATGAEAARTEAQAVAAARDAEFLRRQQAAVAAWQAQPAAQRDPQALERELERLRRSLYDRPRPAPDTPGGSR